MNHTVCRLLFLFVLSMGVMSSPVSKADSCLKVGVLEVPIVLKAAPPLIEEIEKLGQCVESSILAVTRAEKIRRAQGFDLEFFRTRAYAPQLLPTEKLFSLPVRKVSGGIVVKDDTIQKLSDIKGKRIVTVDGVHWVERLMVGADNVKRITAPNSGWEIVNNDKADAYFTYERDWAAIRDKYPDLIFRGLVDLSGYILVAKEDDALNDLLAQAVKNHQQNFAF